MTTLAPYEYTDDSLKHFLTMFAQRIGVPQTEVVLLALREKLGGRALGFAVAELALGYLRSQGEAMPFVLPMYLPLSVPAVEEIARGRGMSLEEIRHALGYAAEFCVIDSHPDEGWLKKTQWQPEWPCSLDEEGRHFIGQQWGEGIAPGPVLVQEHVRGTDLRVSVKPDFMTGAPCVYLSLSNALYAQYLAETGERNPDGPVMLEGMEEGWARFAVAVGKFAHVIAGSAGKFEMHFIRCVQTRRWHLMHLWPYVMV